MPFPDNTKDYFEVSERRGLPLRCPILQRCQRRAHTIADANGWPFTDAERLAGLQPPVLDSIGESAGRLGGENNFISSRQCPEVILFETSVALPGFSGKPTVSGEYDKYLSPQFKIIETGHFSQCAEFAASTVAPIPEDNKEISWFGRNYQWVIGTVIAVLGTIGTFLALTQH